MVVLARWDRHEAAGGSGGWDGLIGCVGDVTSWEKSSAAGERGWLPGSTGDDLSALSTSSSL